ncbi:hypothetical protein EDC94DRAFT_627915, partial [Helicostylum pulchrum]
MIEGYHGTILLPKTEEKWVMVFDLKKNHYTANNLIVLVAGNLVFILICSGTREDIDTTLENIATKNIATENTTQKTRVVVGSVTLYLILLDDLGLLTTVISYFKIAFIININFLVRATVRSSRDKNSTSGNGEERDKFHI